MSDGLSNRKLWATTISDIVHLAASAGLASIGELYTHAFGPEITHVRVVVNRLPNAFEGLTIAHISDFHMGEGLTLKQVSSMVERVNAIHPDIIAITGDFISIMRRHTAAELQTAVTGLRARYGIYAVLGNHDYDTNANTVSQALRDSGNVQLLLNENMAIHRGSDTLYMAGLDDILFKKHSVVQALEGIPEAAAVVLLAHEPDIADHIARTGRVALQLSGHTHGGQLRIPGKGALWLPQLGREYVQGFYQVRDMALYVNRGLGTVVVPVRFNCRAEITLITLAGSSENR